MYLELFLAAPSAMDSAALVSDLARQVRKQRAETSRAIAGAVASTRNPKE